MRKIGRKKQKKKASKRRKVEFRVMYANLDFGMSTKKGELLQRISDRKPHIIALNEICSKTDKDYVESEFKIDNYDMFINKDAARGVALYFDKGLNAYECDELNKENFKESIWCQFNTPNKESVLVGCIYRSPNKNDKDNDKLLFDTLSSDKVKKFDKVCIVGDFNFPHISFDGSFQGGSQGEEVRKKIEDAYMVQMVTEPTRRRVNQTPTRDDWILTNDENFVFGIKHEHPVGKSDHDLLLFNLDIQLSTHRQVSEYMYCIRKGRYDEFREFIKNVDWRVTDNENVEQKWQYIKKVIQEGMSKFIPKRRRNAKK